MHYVLYILQLTAKWNVKPSSHPATSSFIINKKMLSTDITKSFLLRYCLKFHIISTHKYNISSVFTTFQLHSVNIQNLTKERKKAMRERRWRVAGTIREKKTNRKWINIIKEWDHWGGSSEMVEKTWVEVRKKWVFY